jgi:hypothetical protein
MEAVVLFDGRHALVVEGAVARTHGWIEVHATMDEVQKKKMKSMGDGMLTLIRGKTRFEGNLLIDREVGEFVVIRFSVWTIYI